MTEIHFPKTNQVNLSQPAPREKIVVCRGRSCRQYNAEQVFENFKKNLPSDTELMSVPCLGQCGNGAMVVVESDKTWYWQVHPDEVVTIIKQHVMEKSPVKAMLYPKFHK